MRKPDSGLPSSVRPGVRDSSRMMYSRSRAVSSGDPCCALDADAADLDVQRARAAADALRLRRRVRAWPAPPPRGCARTPTSRSAARDRAPSTTLGSPMLAEHLRRQPAHRLVLVAERAQAATAPSADRAACPAPPPPAGARASSSRWSAYRQSSSTRSARAGSRRRAIKRSTATVRGRRRTARTSLRLEGIARASVKVNRWGQRR